jgi:hypothetical protein
MDNISLAIQSLSNDNPSEFRDSIQKELLSRLSDRLDIEKIGVAGRLFGGSAEGESSNEDEEI